MSMKFLKSAASFWKKVSGNVVVKDTSASVGIGTDSPLAPFEVMSTTNPLAMFSYNDSFNGELFIAGTQVNAGYDRNANAILYLNYNGYANGPTQFRDTIIADGKTNALLTVDGSETDVTINVGNLVIGTAGKGIDFSNQASPAAGMTSELLDRYEEGTFTVALGGTDDSGLTNATAYYTRIGNLVYWAYYSQGSTLASGTGSATITGLPFTSASTGNLQYHIFTSQHTTAVDGSSRGGYVVPNDTYAIWIDENSVSPASYIDSANLYIMVSGCYRTAT